jgi:hypothetical protein
LVSNSTISNLLQRRKYQLQLEFTPALSERDLLDQPWLLKDIHSLLWNLFVISAKKSEVFQVVSVTRADVAPGTGRLQSCICMTDAMFLC